MRCRYPPPGANHQANRMFRGRGDGIEKGLLVMQSTNGNSSSLRCFCIDMRDAGRVRHNCPETAAPIHLFGIDEESKRSEQNFRTREDIAIIARIIELLDVEEPIEQRAVSRLIAHAPIINGFRLEHG